MQKADLEALADLLAKFIEENGDKADVRMLGVKPDSLAGRRVIERDDLFFVGDWAIQGKRKLRASWSVEVAPGESERLFVTIEKRNGKYIITDWEVENTMES